MKVIIDKYVPFVEGVLEPYAEVIYADPADINPQTVKDVDALIVRTRTKCNEQLLEGSKVRFVATATIGHDHIDVAYCDEKGIVLIPGYTCDQRVCAGEDTKHFLVCSEVT